MFWHNLDTISGNTSTLIPFESKPALSTPLISKLAGEPTMTAQTIMIVYRGVLRLLASMALPQSKRSGLT